MRAPNKIAEQISIAYEELGYIILELKCRNLLLSNYLSDKDTDTKYVTEIKRGIRKHKKLLREKLQQIKELDKKLRSRLIGKKN